MLLSLRIKMEEDVQQMRSVRISIEDIDVFWAGVRARHVSTKTKLFMGWSHPPRLKGRRPFEERSVTSPEARSTMTRLGGCCRVTVKDSNGHIECKIVSIYSEHGEQKQLYTKWCI
jgi:hypothetical protein